MSSLDFLENVELEGEALEIAPTGYFENVGAAWDMQTSVYNAESRDKVIGEAFEENFETFNNITGEDFGEVFKNEIPRMGGGLVEVSSPEDRLRRRRAIDDVVKKLKAEDPEKYKSLRTYDESIEIAKQRAIGTIQKQDQVYRNANDGLAKLGSFVGTIGGALVDPINLLTLPLGAGAGASALRTALTEGAIGVGTEFLIQPEVKKWNEELGLKYGLEEIAGNIIAAGVGGAAIGAGPMAISKAGLKGTKAVQETAKKVLESKTATEFLSKTRAKLMSMENPPRKAIAAIDHIERMAFVRENDPFLASSMQRGLFSKRHEDGISVASRALFEENLSPRQIDMPYQRQFNELDTTVKDGMDDIDAETLAQVRKYQDPDSVQPVKANESVNEADLKYHRAEAVEISNRQRTDDSMAKVKPEDFEDTAVIGKVNKKTGKASVLVNGKKKNVKVKSLNKIEPNQAAIIREMPDGSLEAYGLSKYQPTKKIGNITSKVSNQDNYNPIAEVFESRAYPDDIEAEIAISRDAGSEEAQIAIIADFNRLVDENPDLKITDADGNVVTVKQLRDDLEMDGKAVDAMKSCAIGS